MRKLLATTALLTAIALPSHANNTALISVDRAFQLQYIGSIFTVTLDGKEVCELATGDDCVTGTAPGQHRIEIDVTHWLKADEHAVQVVTLKTGEKLELEVGYSCTHWVQVNPRLIGSCAGDMYVETVKAEYAENAKSTPGYY